ncbi:response regulator [Candidatus Thorarchaeota archaeon]|nr:MAG: response regulator [Candidatus Thorarchaeota archaeon]
MKIRVLVVDDDEDLLFLAEKFLTRENDKFELVSANTDQEALQILEEENFDAIVCDHYLGPHSMTGLDLLEWVRDSHPNIPFIIFTGRSQESVAIRALNLGADFYLKKGSQDIKDLFSQIALRIKTEVESRRTEEALETAYNELERRVKERTAELEEINRQLLHEISERQKVEDALRLQRDLGNTLCKTHNLIEALDHILKASVHLEGVDCGGIYLADTNTGNFDLPSSTGISAHFLKAFSGRRGAESIKEPKYLSTSDIVTSKNIEKEYRDLTSVAIIPVLFDGVPKAILALGSHSYDEIPIRDRHTLEAIATQIGAYMTRLEVENTIMSQKKSLQ